MKYFFLLFTFIFIGCSKDDQNSDSNLESETFDIKLNKTLVQKGPFVEGSSILIVELDNDLESTSISYNTETIDDFGSFNFNGSLNTNHIDIVATGFYFNEITGEISDGQVTLRNFLEVGDNVKANINILTTLSRQRIKFLLKASDITYIDAKKQAEREVLNAFNIPTAIIDSSLKFEEMDISKGGVSNAVLLAVSCMLQGNNNDGELSELITKFANDLESDGAVDTDFVKSKIKEGSSVVDPEVVKQNLINRFESLGITYEIPEFENFIDFDGNGILYGYDVTPLFPKDEISNTRPTFEWAGSSEEGVSYDIQLSKNIEFTDLVFVVDEFMGTQMLSPEPLEIGKFYYWRIKMKKGEDSLSDWKVMNFSTKNYDITNLAPNGGGEMGNSNPSYVWTDIDLENRYFQFQLATDELFNNIIVDVSNITTNEYKPEQLLVDNVMYYWRVRFLDENGVESNWVKEYFKFELPIIMNGIPREIGDNTPKFTWAEPYFIEYPPESITYHLQLSTDPDFNDIVVDVDNISGLEYQLNLKLTYNTEYYYRMRMKDSNNVISEWNFPLQFKYILKSIDLGAAPQPSGFISDNNPLFDWNKPIYYGENFGPDEIIYQIQVATDNDFSNIILDVNDLEESQYQFNFAFSYNVDYYYRIRYRDQENITSEWSRSNFTVKN